MFLMDFFFFGLELKGHINFLKPVKYLLLMRSVDGFLNCDKAKIQNRSSFLRRLLTKYLLTSPWFIEAGLSRLLLPSTHRDGESFTNP